MTPARANAAERVAKRHARLVAAGRAPAAPVPPPRPAPQAPTKDADAQPANPFAHFMGCAP